MGGEDKSNLINKSAGSHLGNRMTHPGQPVTWRRPCFCLLYSARWPCIPPPGLKHVGTRCPRRPQFVHSFDEYELGLVLVVGLEIGASSRSSCLYGKYSL